jgi:DNA-binding response OmpR family regulator
MWSCGTSGCRGWTGTTSAGQLQEPLRLLRRDVHRLGHDVDMLIGLAVHADYNPAKPFSPRGLIARIHTLLPDGPLRVFGELALGPQAREVTLADRAVTVTWTEFDLRDALSDRPRMVFDRRQLIDRVWGEGWVGDGRIVGVHLGHVRHKLDNDPAARFMCSRSRGVANRMSTG